MAPEVSNTAGIGIQRALQAIGEGVSPGAGSLKFPGWLSDPESHAR